jgi:hypothetical protein
MKNKKTHYSSGFFLLHRLSLKSLNGAGGRGRTGMGSLPLDFESSASTNFTTPAIFGDYSGSPCGRQGRIGKGLAAVMRQIKCIDTPYPICYKGQRKRGCSSVGRALEWHSRGRQFDPDQLHHVCNRVGEFSPAFFLFCTIKPHHEISRPAFSLMFPNIPVYTSPQPLHFDSAVNLAHAGSLRYQL